MSEATSSDVIIGVDTHKQTHTAVAITGLGARVGELTVSACTQGYHDLEAWAASLGSIRGFAIEGTGSYGAGLSRFLRESGHTVHEVCRPDSTARRITSAPRSQPAHASAAIARPFQSPGRARQR